MKNFNNNIILFGIIAIITSACKKAEVITTPVATVNIINDIVNGGSVKTNFASHTDKVNYFSGITPIAYGSNAVYGTLAGIDNPLNVAPTDTTQSLLKTTINLPGGTLYSLYLAGQTSAVDNLLIQDNVPARTDSTAGIRFINLSYNSTPIAINITGSANGSEVSSLAYKSITDFKSYNNDYKHTAYTFEFRNASTGVLLTSYAMSGTALPRFKNVTLVIKGVSGVTSGTTALGIQLVKNY